MKQHRFTNLAEERTEIRGNCLCKLLPISFSDLHTNEDFDMTSRRLSCSGVPKERNGAMMVS